MGSSSPTPLAVSQSSFHYFHFILNARAKFPPFKDDALIKARLCKHLDMAMALKLIHRELVAQAEVVERFHREMKSAASLNHPNIVTAHDAEQADDLHFLPMEYVNGQDLAEVVRQRGPLPVSEACEFIRQAAEGAATRPSERHGAP